MYTSPKYNKVSIYRISDIYITEIFKILIHQLSRNHSEVRLASLQIIKELFQRSHFFRELLAADFQDFSKLVLDIDPKAPLPPPPAALKQLKLMAMQTIKEWYEVYGEAYKKLKIGYLYLMKSKAIDFEDMEARSAQERLRIQAREAKLNSMKQEKLQKLMEELSSEEGEMTTCVTQIENGFVLLVPDEFAIKETDKSTDLASESNISNCDFRAHGMINFNFNLVVEVKPFQIEVTQDNQEIIQFLQDQYRLLTARFLPMVFKWNVIAAKLGAEERLQKKILDLKLKLELTAQKYQELNLSSCNVNVPMESSSDPDSDLETVPDDDLDHCEDQTLRIVDNLTGDPALDIMPGTSNTVYRMRRKESQAKLPIDIDSYATSQSNLPLPTFSQ